ncbi:MAG: hypothetical protein H0U95_11925 [Bacteroidetes bacterium]|nr:hypothetical protein [Bacteroidota bacterium]
MKKFISIFIFLGPLLTIGQESSNKVIPKRNTIYLEAYGQGVYNSLSFDRLYRLDKKVRTSFTAGLTFLPLLHRPAEMLAIGTPVSYNWLFGQKRSHLELGIGLTFLSLTKRTNSDIEPAMYSTNSFLYLTPKISYRFQNPNGGLFFRVSFAPTVALWSRERYRSLAYNDLLRQADNPIPGSGDMIFPWPGFSLGYTLK